MTTEKRISELNEDPLRPDPPVTDDFNRLIEPDQMSLRFGPHGLLLSATIDPAGSARYLRAVVERERLHRNVPAPLHQAHQRIIEVHMHGLFNYGLFSIAEQAAWMFPEAALGQRFVAWYGGRVPITVDGVSEEREVSDYRSVAGLFARPSVGGHTVALDEPLLRGGRRFNGSFAALMAWGRATGALQPWLDLQWATIEPALTQGLITGGVGTYALPEEWSTYSIAQRTNWWAQFRKMRWEPDQLANLVDLRNLSAHQLPTHTVSPVQSAHAIVSAAVFANAIWEGTDST